MRRYQNSWIYRVAVAVVFIVLQGTAIFLMARYSVTQQAGIVHSLNSGHYFLWEYQQRVGRYFSLNTVNKELANENRRLRSELFNVQSTVHPTTPMDTLFSLVVAEVVQNTTSSLQNYLIINKGSDHGLMPDMGVIGDQGVVGIVRDVNRRYSKVMSLLNTRFQTNARIEPNGNTGQLTWSGKSIHTAKISDMPQHSLVSAGDTAYTSGFSDIFPAHIPLGVVTGTTITQGTFMDAEIRLFLNFNTLRYVYVINNLYSQEINDLKDEP